MKKIVLIAALFLLRSELVHAQVDLADGLVGNLPFDGNESPGTAFGATLTTDRFGNPNAAYSFDGDDYISIPTEGLENENFTYSVWVNVNQLPASGAASCIISIGTYQTLMLHNNYGSTDGFTAGSYYSASSAGSYSTDQLPVLDTWYHLVYVRSNDKVKLYVNGTLHGEISTSGNLPYYNALTCNLGARNNNLQQPFNGKIDDVRIYNRVLSECEILATYNGSTSTDDLIGNYPFSGDASDLSVTNNDGNVVGATLVSDRLGNPNAAYSFDGDDYISISKEGLENENFTYSVWVNVNQLPASGDASCIISIGTYQTLMLHNSYGSTDGFTAGSYYSASSAGSYSTDQLPVLDTWYHLVYVRSNDNVKLYVNGALHGGISTNGNLPYYNDLACSFGARNNSLQQPFDGILDDVRIYDRALEECEITELYEENLVTSTESSLEESSFVVYPNPSSGKFRIQLPESEKCTFTLINQYGQEVARDIHYQNGNINVENLPKGYYILTIETADAVQYKSLIFE